MDHPTREEFNDHEARIKKLEQQQTEPIKIARVEVASEDAVKRLDSIQEDTNILKIEMAGARADILQIRESQADLRDRLVEHRQHFKAIKDDQDTHTGTLGQLISLSEGHTTRFDRIDANMATKEDLTAMATKDDITRLENLIKQFLPKPPEGQP